MSSRSKKKLTVDRTKALRFIAKQEFYNLEETKEEKSNVRILERDWYTNATDNNSYAQQICTYAVQRHLILLEKCINKMNISNPNRMQQISTRDHLKQRTQMCINNKLMQFYQTVGLPPPFMNQPFIVQTNHIPNPIHTNIQKRYQYPYAQMSQIQQMQQMQQFQTTTIQQPPTKKMKLSHPKITTKKTKEEIENEKINRLKLPSNLINSHKLQQWLDNKLQLLTEYENLITKSIKNNKKLLSEHRNAIMNLRRDIDILKSTVMQEMQQDNHNNKNNKNKWSENKELKRVYLDIMKMDKDLPVLREKHIKPLINKYVQEFNECDLKKSILAQKNIKKILIENKFKKKAENFCNIIGKQFIRNELFYSEINNILNDDLELLNDFGVKFVVKTVANDDTFNLRIIFCGHFGNHIDEEWHVPNLVVLLNESKYKHYYGMLPCFQRLKQRFIDFIFVSKEKEKDIFHDMDMDDEDIIVGRFTKKHIKWLDNYKMNTLKSNGEFVSIVNIYNFYHDSVKALIKQMTGNKSKLKSVCNS